MLMLMPDSTFWGLEDKYSKRVYSISTAKEFNQKGYGVFIAPNDFEGRLCETNLKKIKFCFFEIDNIPKDEQLKKIKASPLRASRVIESKNSYHVYFRLKDDCAIDSFSRIQSGLIEHFNSDTKIKNVNRLMRAPGFYHMKDPLDPFLVTIVEDNDLEYRIDDLKSAFPYEPKIQPTNLSGGADSDSLAHILENLDHEKALNQLSGTPFVNYETYTFKTKANGKKNIYVNGLGTSCFIDEKGLIGADPGGPTIWQWLRYFKHSNSQIRRIIRDVYDI